MSLSTVEWVITVKFSAGAGVLPYHQEKLSVRQRSHDAHT